MDADARARVVLVHDWLTGMRGGEKCLEPLCRRWPDARLYTLFHKRGSYDQINIAAKSGTSPTQLVSAVKPLMGPSAQVRTGQAQAQQVTKDTSSFPSRCRGEHLPSIRRPISGSRNRFAFGRARLK